MIAALGTAGALLRKVRAMLLESQLERVSPNITPYVEELRAIYKGHGLQAGSLDNFAGLASRLSTSGSLAEEVSAKIRSLIYREHETLNEAELLHLLTVSILDSETVSILDSEVDERAPQFTQAVQQLRSFLGTALRAFWRSSADGPYKSKLAKSAPQSGFTPSSPVQDRNAPTANDMALGSDSLADLSASEPSLQDEHIARNQRAVEDEVARMMERERLQGVSGRPARVVEEILVLDDKEPSPANNAPALRAVSEPLVQRDATRPVQPLRTSLGSARQIQEAAGPVISVAPAVQVTGSSLRPVLLPSVAQPATQDAEEEGVFPEHRSLGIYRPEHRALWIVGALGILLGLLMGLLLHGHGPAEVPVGPKGVPSRESALPSSPALSGKPNSSEVPARNLDGKDLRTLDAQRASAGADHGAGHGATPQLPVRVAGHVAAQAPMARYSPESEEPSGSLAPGSPLPNAAEERSAPGLKPAASPSQAVFLSASGVMARNLVVAPAPTYPAEASASGVQGKVVIQALIGRDGHVLDTHVISGDPRLCEAALNAVSRWRYRPFLANGKPAEIETTATLDFRMFRREP